LETDLAEFNAVPFFNGADWQVAGTNLLNDGTSVGIGTSPSLSNSRLIVEDLSAEAIAGRSVIRAERSGLFAAPGGLTSWVPEDCDAAIRAFSDWGNAYSASIYGSGVLDFENSAAVVGADFFGEVYGALAYNRGPGNGIKAGFFHGDVEITENTDMGGNVTVGESLTVENNLTVNEDVSLWESLYVDQNTELNGGLLVNGSATFQSDLNAAATITVSDNPEDEVAFHALGAENYYQSGTWLVGETAGGNGASTGDYIMKREGSDAVDYIFWESQFKPGDDNTKTLGGAENRWSTLFAANGTINTSDAREKKNIRELEYGLETLMDLKPVSYEWQVDAMKVGKKLGFVAQDLLETVPEVVVTQKRVENRETGEVRFEEAERYGVFYDDLIPVLTKAIQEQQGTIKEQDSTIGTLENTIRELREDLTEALTRIDYVERDLQTCCFGNQTERGSSTDTERKIPELGQNVPNPFSESTVIQYYLPANVGDAIIRITDMNGSPIEDLRLENQKGVNQVEFRTHGLAAGTYLYSLFVDGKFVSTKKMVLAR
jgi:hypothetical protein